VTLKVWDTRKIHERQNDRKGGYSLARMVEKTAKKLRMKWITGTEKRRIWFIHLKTLKKKILFCVL
jgi:hypothetical protein